MPKNRVSKTSLARGTSYQLKFPANNLKTKHNGENRDLVLYSITDLAKKVNLKAELPIKNRIGAGVEVITGKSLFSASDKQNLTARNKSDVYTRADSAELGRKN